VYPYRVWTFGRFWRFERVCSNSHNSTVMSVRGQLLPRN